MSFPLTLTLFLASAALAALAQVMSGRRRDRLDPPRLPVPWTWVQILAVVFCLLLAAHLVSLATGQTLRGRLA